jgi:hypothetical protein
MTAEQEINAALKGEGCLGKAAPDEPVFVLRAQDRFAADVVRHWANLVGSASEGSNPKVFEAQLHADIMETWRIEHGGGKVPD